MKKDWTLYAHHILDCINKIKQIKWVDKKQMKINLCHFIVSFFLFLPTSYAVAWTSLPLAFNTGNPEPHGLPSTIISIQGKILPIIFDTGASKSEITLSHHALKGLSVEFTGNQVCTTALDGEHCEPEFIIPEVTLGDIVLKNVKGTLMEQLWGGDDDGFISTEASENGVIGYDLLKKFNILLDYPNKQAVLFNKGEKPKNYDISNWIAIPFTDHLKTKVILNKKVLTLSWDTGSVPSIIKTSIANEMIISQCDQNTPYGKEEDCKRIVTNSFYTLGDHAELPLTWFLVKDIPQQAPFDGLIGSNFYMEHLVYFDFAHHQILVKP